MKPVLTADEYRRVDKAYEGDLTQAMDKAGYAVALAAARAGAGYGKRVVVLAGPGNNGGDGYVAARYLKARGADVEVQALAPPKTTEAIDAATKADAVGVRIVELGEPDDSDVIVDALFGGGTRSGLPDSVTAWMDTEVPVIAVDYPTGLDPNTGIVEDRRFYLVDQHGRLLTQRQVGSLVQLESEYRVEPEWLGLVFPDGTRLEGPVELGEEVSTPMWGRTVSGRVLVGDWSRALSAFCQQPVTLVRSDEPGQCYDEYPISLVSQASVQGLRRRAPPSVSLDSRRFRPNFV
ncbi:MAG: NAD(P)H-hydrate epimerase, partial [Acidobacteria bacterium]|nr:NAD(P)H-hydrate epimerase [Acidobacteriota bacterium]